MNKITQVPFAKVYGSPGGQNGHFHCGSSTVQTAWKPAPTSTTKEDTTYINLSQNPLSGEMDKNIENCNIKNKANERDLKKENKKWSLKKFFRRKKEIEIESSSEEDRKAGFSPDKTSSTPRRKGRRSSSGKNSIASGFDHIVVSPKEELFLPLEPIDLNEAGELRNFLPISSSTGTIQTPSNLSEKHCRRDRKKCATARLYQHNAAQQYQSSSEEDIHSINSASVPLKYRSDESFGSGSHSLTMSNGNSSRRSRTARNERYLKRIHRDDVGNINNNNNTIGPYPPASSSLSSLPISSDRRWKTQPIQMISLNQCETCLNCQQQQKQVQRPYLNNSTSLTHMAINNDYDFNVIRNDNNFNDGPSHNVNYYNDRMQYHNGVNNNKRSLSYDNHINNVQPIYSQIPKTTVTLKKEPPPPPPRDPQRRLNISHYELRPISYSFDQNPNLMNSIKSRSASDDRIWGPPPPMNDKASQQVNSIARPSSTQPIPQPRRFVARTPQEAVGTFENSSSHHNANDYKYVADAVPRSRKPIHVFSYEDPTKSQPKPSPFIINPDSPVRTTKSGLTVSPGQSASEFWKRLDQAQAAPKRGRDPESRGAKFRSISGSRVMDYNRNNRTPVPFMEIKPPFIKNYESNLNQSHERLPNNSKDSFDDIDNVVQGSLFIKPTKDSENNYIQIVGNTTKNNYQQPNIFKPSVFTPAKAITTKKILPTPLSKYDVNISKNTEVKDTLREPSPSVKKIQFPPAPPQRKCINLTETDFTENLRKSRNLEEAINELDAIYKSLKLGDEELLDRAELRDFSTPTNLNSKCSVLTRNDALNNNHDIMDDDDHSDGEPDIIKDDFAYRAIQRTNGTIKTVETQPPFGIPIGPVAPSPNTDYLRVTPEKKKNKIISQNCPDLISDDMAVRSWRKDSGNINFKPAFMYPNSTTLKKKRATRTQSANIYALIQRDAAKPSGGSLYDYYDSEHKPVGKAGSMSDVRDVDDIPSTLFLLQSLKQEEQREKMKNQIFRHPSQGGAVFNLPSTLNKTSSPKTADADNNSVFSKLRTTNRESSAEITSAFKPPVPLPRKSISPEPERNRSGMEEVLNKIAREAKESSEKLNRDLMELRKESATRKNSIAQGEVKPKNAKIENDIKIIDGVSQKAKEYGEMLLEAIPSPQKLPTAIMMEIPTSCNIKKLDKESEMIKDIDKVSEAAKNCEKKLEAITFKSPSSAKSSPVMNNRKEEESNLETVEGITMVGSIFQKLEPNGSKIGEIAERCMRQLSELGDLKDEEVHDYDNLPPKYVEEKDTERSFPKTSNIAMSIQSNLDINSKDAEPDYANIPDVSSLIIVGPSAEIIQRESEKFCKEPHFPLVDEKENSHTHDSSYKRYDESMEKAARYESVYDQIPQSADEAQIFSSSSDCIKSSSPTPSQQRNCNKSSSITSVHAFSSSDNVKSLTTSSSDYRTPSTDRIKTFSTTSYDVKSSSMSAPFTENSSCFSTTTAPSSPSPLAILGDKNGVPLEDSPSSQYNSSEELAMIFGLRRSSSPRTTSTTTPGTGNWEKRNLKRENNSLCVMNANNFNTNENKNCDETTRNAMRPLNNKINVDGGFCELPNNKGNKFPEENKTNFNHEIRLSKAETGRKGNEFSSSNFGYYPFINIVSFDVSDIPKENHNNSLLENNKCKLPLESIPETHDNEESFCVDESDENDTARNEYDACDSIFLPASINRNTTSRCCTIASYCNLRNTNNEDENIDNAKKNKTIDIIITDADDNNGNNEHNNIDYSDDNNNSNNISCNISENNNRHNILTEFNALLLNDNSFFNLNIIKDNESNSDSGNVSFSDFPITSLNLEKKIEQDEDRTTLFSSQSELCSNKETIFNLSHLELIPHYNSLYNFDLPLNDDFDASSFGNNSDKYPFINQIVISAISEEEKEILSTPETTRKNYEEELFTENPKEHPEEENEINSNENEVVKRTVEELNFRDDDDDDYDFKQETIIKDIQNLDRKENLLPIIEEETIEHFAEDYEDENTRNETYSERRRLKEERSSPSPSPSSSSSSSSSDCPSTSRDAVMKSTTIPETTTSSRRTANLSNAIHGREEEEEENPRNCDNNNNNRNNNGSGELPSNLRRNNGKQLMMLPQENRNTLIQQIIVACSFLGIASQDVFTFLVIIVAILTIVALIIL